ncbi:DNA polymerase IV [Nakamurella leprariae]
MDAFFASVELRSRPDLRDRPMLVAGRPGPDRLPMAHPDAPQDPRRTRRSGRSAHPDDLDTGIEPERRRPTDPVGDRRGVVLSANYPARRYGIRSAMPTAAARALCPGLVVLPPDYAAYREASDALMRMLRDVTPLVEPLSVDEAFLDVSGARRRSGSPSRIAADLRARIADELQLTATVGAASTKFVAKLASGWAKPDGMLVVPPERVLELLHPLPVRALWGVGPATAARLESVGLNTVGEIAAADLRLLTRVLGTAVGTNLHRLASGVDERVVTPDTVESSLGAEHTYADDTPDPDVWARTLLQLAGRTGARARAGGARGRTVTIKIRFADWTTITRSSTVEPATDITQVIYRTATALLHRAVPAGRRIRLLGVRLENLLHDGPSDPGRDDQTERRDDGPDRARRPGAGGPAITGGAVIAEQLAFDLGPTVVAAADGPAAPAAAVSADSARRWASVDRVADLLVDRFGAAALRPGSVLGPGRPADPPPAARHPAARPSAGPSRSRPGPPAPGLDGPGRPR